jgi:hypothetical protein
MDGRMGQACHAEARNVQSCVFSRQKHLQRLPRHKDVRRVESTICLLPPKWFGDAF